MYRLGYRNFGSHQTMVVNHTVDTGSDHAGIRWYELRKTSAGWSISQQGTYSPDSVNRFMGSAAMDRTGDIAVGYSVAGAEHVPGHPLRGPPGERSSGTLAQGETHARQRLRRPDSGASHWGDYSMMSVDPRNDCTFWYAQEYYTQTGKLRLAHADRLLQAPELPPDRADELTPQSTGHTKRSAGESRRSSFR